MKLKKGDTLPDAKVFIIDTNPLYSDWLTENYTKKTVDNRLEVVKLLFENWVDINEKNEKWEWWITPLKYVIKKIKYANEDEKKVLESIRDFFIEKWVRYSDKFKLEPKVAFKKDFKRVEENYNKDLGFWYTQKVSWIWLDRKTIYTSIYLYNKWLLNPTSPTSFSLLNKYYVKDTKWIWFKSKQIYWVDIETFEILNKGNWFYWRDNDSLYAYWKKLKGTNKNYKFYWNQYIWSNKKVFFNSNEIIWVDLNTFEVLDFPFSKDKNNSYKNEKVFIK